MKGRDDKIKIGDSGSYFTIEILSDKLDLFDTPDILSSVENAIKKNNYPNLIVDLKNIDHIDSAGIGLLIAIQNMISKSGRKLAITGACDKVMSIFRLTKMGTFFQIFEDPEKAVTYMNSLKKITAE